MLRITFRELLQVAGFLVCIYFALCLVLRLSGAPWPGGLF